MKQMPRLTLAAPPLVIPIRAGLVCGSRVRESGNTTANQDCSYELLVIIGGDVLRRGRSHPLHPVFPRASFICQV